MVSAAKIYVQVSLVISMQQKILVNSHKMFSLLILREKTKDCIMELIKDLTMLD